KADFLLKLLRYDPSRLMTLARIAKQELWHRRIQNEFIATTLGVLSGWAWRLKRLFKTQSALRRDLRELLLSTVRPVDLPKRWGRLVSPLLIFILAIASVWWLLFKYLQKIEQSPSSSNYAQTWEPIPQSFTKGIENHRQSV